MKQQQELRKIEEDPEMEDEQEFDGDEGKKSVDLAHMAKSVQSVDRYGKAKISTLNKADDPTKFPELHGVNKL